MVAALRERDRRGPVLRPNAVCRSRPPAPSGAGGPACVRTRAEGLSGGNWMGVRRPRYAGPPEPPGWSHPDWYTLLWSPSGGPGCPRVRPRRRPGAPAK